MSTSHVTLQASEEIAEGTMAFHFRRPPGFIFRAGQAIDLVLPNAPDVNGQSGRHAFSIVSAPFEQELVVATRMRDSAYKRALKSSAIGATADIDGPFGALTLHNDRTRSAVFIAGGIGITPFMSMLRQATHDRSPQMLLLLYSNRRPEDAAFFSELQDLEQQNVNFRLIATMTDTTKSARPWLGESSPINEAFIRRNVAGLVKPVFYVVGPPGMVAAMREALNRIGVDDDDICSEEFYGY